MALSWRCSHSSDDAGSADGRGTAAGSGADGADHVGAHYCSGPNGRRCQDVEVLPWSEGLFSSMEQKAQRGLGRNRPFLIRRDSSPAREWAALKPGASMCRAVLRIPLHNLVRRIDRTWCCLTAARLHARSKSISHNTYVLPRCTCGLDLSTDIVAASQVANGAGRLSI